MDKQSIRRQVKDKLSALSDDEIANRSRHISEQLIEVVKDINPNTVLSYMALKNEVNVSIFNRFCLENNISLYLPRVNEDSLETVQWGETVTGAFNVSEPVGQAETIDFDIVIVPVTAVSSSCERLGKGKGYYDKFLSGKKCLKIAAAFNEQLFDSLPVQDHDVTMDVVIVG